VGWIRHNLNTVRRMKARFAERLYTLYLPNGEKVTYDTEELLEALGATIERREYPLRSALKSTEGNNGLEGLVRALEASYVKEEEE
jgi:hypothetical protein